MTMRIEDKGRPVHADATAKIRPRIFLEGNFFVDLTAGSPSAPELDDGATIPVQQTATPVQLDEVVTALQSDTRDDLKTLLDEYGKALDGAGAKGFNRSIPYWEPAYRDGSIVSDAMRGETGHDLSGYIKNAGATAAALDRNREPPEVAGHRLQHDRRRVREPGRQPRRRGRRAAAHAARRLSRRSARSTRRSRRVRALAAELRPGVQNSSETLDAALPFVQQLRGLVSQQELRGLAADLRADGAGPRRSSSSAASRSTARSAARRAARTRSSTRGRWTRCRTSSSRPRARSTRRRPSRCPGLAGESRSADANGSWFRVLAAGGKNLVTFSPGVFGTTPEPLIGANPPKPQKRPPLDGSVPCETQEPPDLRTNPAAPPPQHTVNTGAPAFQARYDQGARQGRRRGCASSSRPRTWRTSARRSSPSDATPQLHRQDREGGK